MVESYMKKHKIISSGGDDDIAQEKEFEGEVCFLDQNEIIEFDPTQGQVFFRNKIERQEFVQGVGIKKNNGYLQQTYNET